MPHEFPAPPEPGQPWSEDLARWYDTHYGEHPLNALAVEAAGLSGFETLVDIGCGAGAAVRAAALALPDGQAIGLDPSPAMIRIAREKAAGHPAYERLSFAESGAEPLPFETQSADVVLAINSLHHWSGKRRGLTEVARVLRPRGRLVVIEEVFTEEGRGLDALSLRQLLESTGFSVTMERQHQLPDCQANIFIAQPEEQS